MSLSIFKLFILFLLIESSIAKYVSQLADQDLNIVDYSSLFKEMIEGWQREATEKYPFRPDFENYDGFSFRQNRDQTYANRSFFIQDKAQAYVRQWTNYKPYRDLGDKIGVLWPTQDDTCPETEAMNLLTYMLHGLSRRHNILRWLK
ncbi:hypothetical protein CARUB_v10006560mg [Capsella rubella]|uniref:Neprosin domain-containing protein n=1 Tax=Capsella rubella TaxID=81985 RepID=R0F879_9BRAS|nr:uncharacterized protein LOC17880985 [Capsella rubella]EOA18102.1 hypothetical protein CARUB_v10006560mg [Capsella rubella]